MNKYNYWIILINTIERLIVFGIIGWLLVRTGLNAHDWELWTLFFIMGIQISFENISGKIKNMYSTSGPVSKDAAKNTYSFPCETSGSGKTPRSTDYLKPCSCGSFIQPFLIYKKEDNNPYKNVIAVCSDCGRHTQNPADIKKAIFDWNNNNVTEVTNNE